MASDEQLVRQSLSGNEEAFRQLVETYKAYVFAIILNFIPDPFEAENIAQETFLQIYRSLPQYRYLNFKGWVGKIAANKALDWRRALAKRPGLYPLEDIENIAARPAPDGKAQSSPEEEVLSREERGQVRKVYAALPEQYRRTVGKFYLEGKDYRRIALEEGTTIKTVESRLYRARNLLREKWKEME